MGVPSYFSYIIKTHTHILHKYMQMVQSNISFARLYMDCNSILYDSFHSVDRTQTPAIVEKEILDKTSAKIEEYIAKIRPTECVYIAFDGVAPLAKIAQQKTRRYKSWFESANVATFESTPTPEISSSMFTPGTDFMKKLSAHIKRHFLNDSMKQKHHVRDIYVATPDHPGEGEHKLYTHLRENPLDSTQSIVVYGLDADLIMLSLFHLTYCPNIYVMREAPAFAHVLIQQETKVKVDETEPLFLEIGALGRCIASEMDCACPDPHRMYDYVFLCFLLGNDFLPHFPALNIRTHGIQRILDVYRQVIGNVQGRFLIRRVKPYTICWREVTRLFQGLAKHELGFIKQEYVQRKKWDHKTVHSFPTKTVKEKMDLIQNLPVLCREKERFINPYESNWEYRYYHTLFSGEISPENAKPVCINYLEGLEWVFQYYTNACIDWRWSYQYMYPPLLKDLVKYVPFGQTSFFDVKKAAPESQCPLKPTTQLAMVMPPALQKQFLPFHIQEILAKKYAHCFPKMDEMGNPILEFEWAFCRYFWESHVVFPTVSTETIREWEMEF